MAKGPRVGALKQHLDKQEETQSLMQKKLDDVLFLLGGGGIGKIAGLVDVVNGLSAALDTMLAQFEHAEKWRRDFKASQAEYEARNQKRRALIEQREHEVILKDKEIGALKRSSKMKNWIAAAAIIFTLAKAIFDYYNK